jgi:hypothetical protein
MGADDAGRSGRCSHEPTDYLSHQGVRTKNEDPIPVSFSIVRDAKHSFAAAVEPPGMPTTLVLDQKGIVRLVHVGFHADSSEAALQATISKLLDAPAH